MRTRREQRFGDVLVVVDHSEGRAAGSLIHFGGLRWHLPAWPYRIASIEEAGTGIAITMRDGTHKLLEACDAEPEPEAAA